MGSVQLAIERDEPDPFFHKVLVCAFSQMCFRGRQKARGFGAGEQVVLRVFVLCLDEFFEELAGVGDRFKNDALTRGVLGFGGFDPDNVQNITSDHHIGHTKA